MSNSIEHSNLNSTITLDFRDLETEYRVTITDEGTGFSDLFLASLPSKYVSSKLDNTASHGLGLYHVKEMVERHNGTLLIENRPEKNQTGAKVTLVFKK
ncbi:sensor histidine kinase [Vagococcus teuberi]|uniref:sensor histidine kinase n=1 Tax=Vagococcus teuberi TaxID=519472 RepID=UPI0023EA5CB7|nr:ATP-binding protein [Vagococcus teuberi]